MLSTQQPSPCPHQLASVGNEGPNGRTVRSVSSEPKFPRQGKTLFCFCSVAAERNRSRRRCPGPLRPRQPERPPTTREAPRLRERCSLSPPATPRQHPRRSPGRHGPRAPELRAVTQEKVSCPRHGCVTTMTVVVSMFSGRRLGSGSHCLEPEADGLPSPPRWVETQSPATTRVAVILASAKGKSA